MKHLAASADSKKSQPFSITWHGYLDIDYLLCFVVDVNGDDITDIVSWDVQEENFLSLLEEITPLLYKPSYCIAL